MTLATDLFVEDAEEHYYSFTLELKTGSIETHSVMTRLTKAEQAKIYTLLHECKALLIPKLTELLEKHRDSSSSTD